MSSVLCVISIAWYSPKFNQNSIQMTLSHRHCNNECFYFQLLSRLWSGSNKPHSTQTELQLTETLKSRFKEVYPPIFALLTFRPHFNFRYSKLWWISFDAVSENGQQSDSNGFLFRIYRRLKWLSLTSPVDVVRCMKFALNRSNSKECLESNSINWLRNHWKTK